MGRVFSWVPRGAHWQWPSAHTHTQTHTHILTDIQTHTHTHTHTQDTCRTLAGSEEEHI